MEFGIRNVELHKCPLRAPLFAPEQLTSFVTPIVEFDGAIQTLAELSYGDKSTETDSASGAPRPPSSIIWMPPRRKYERTYIHGKHSSAESSIPDMRNISNHCTLVNATAMSGVRRLRVYSPDMLSEVPGSHGVHSCVNLILSCVAIVYIVQSFEYESRYIFVA